MALLFPSLKKLRLREVEQHAPGYSKCRMECLTSACLTHVINTHILHSIIATYINSMSLLTCGYRSTHKYCLLSNIGPLERLKLVILYNPVLTLRVGMCLTMDRKTAEKNTTAFSETEAECAKSHGERKGGADGFSLFHEV